MGCYCCKEVNPADYEKCQLDRDRILRNKKPTSSKRYVAPCGESFTFGAKFTMPKRRENIRDKQYDSTRVDRCLE